MKRINVLFVGLALLVSSPVGTAQESSADSRRVNQVLEWNQIFIDTLIATNTANSSSQRLGAIVHTAIFDAYNGIERRYTPIFVHSHGPPDGASRRAAVVAAAYTALVGLFPSRQAALDASYAASLAALSERLRNGGQSRRRRRSCETRIERGVAWGTEVAQAVLAWRATDGFSASPIPRSTGGPRSASGGRHRRRAPLRADERAGIGIHGDVRPGQQHPVRSRTAARSERAPRTRTISTQSRRSVVGPGRRALTTRRRSLHSGRATRAFTGIRQRTRLLAPTTCPCRTATVFSRS